MGCAFRRGKKIVSYVVNRNQFVLRRLVHNIQNGQNNVVLSNLNIKFSHLNRIELTIRKNYIADSSKYLKCQKINKLANPFTISNCLSIFLHNCISLIHRKTKFYESSLIFFELLMFKLGNFLLLWFKHLGNCNTRQVLKKVCEIYLVRICRTNPN